MGRTPDRRPGAQEEDDQILFDDRGSHPGTLGALYRYGDDFFAHDGAGYFNLRSGSGITESQHENLDTLVHGIAENAYLEVVRASGKVTDIIFWTDSGKTQKIRETNITRASGKVSQIVRKQYDGAGALITGQTLTGTVTRSSGKVASIDWVES